ncbi:alpha/beta hydrolase family protein [Oceaniferula spumae]
MKLSRLKTLTTLALCVISGAAPLIADETSLAADRKQIEQLDQLTAVPKMQAAEGFDSTPQLRAIYFDALDWKGKPTKVFAWLGLPAKTEGKVPGIVLVHGGGGTAFKNWVQMWNDKGYAAISIAVEGQIDRRPKGERKEGAYWQRHKWPGPTRQGIYGDSNVPLKEQWMYHAVADTILANSLLRSLPEVDGSKVGLMGISWGGVITSTVIGIDQRFAFAIPTYGCGNLATVENQYGRALGNNPTYKQVWDPMLRLNRATMPTLWFSWPGDKHFPMDKFAMNYGAVKGPYMVSLIPKMGHGHGPPWKKPDSYAFADSIVRDGKAWCRQTSVKRDGRTFSATFESSKPLQTATLISTTDTGITGNREWIESSASLEKKDGKWIAQAELPKGSTAWFINVHSDKLTVSSDYQEANLTTSPSK